MFDNIIRKYRLPILALFVGYMAYLLTHGDVGPAIVGIVALIFGYLSGREDDGSEGE